MTKKSDDTLHVFISYSYEDKNVAGLTRRLLKNLNLKKPIKVFDRAEQFVQHAKPEQSEAEQVSERADAASGGEFKFWEKRSLEFGEKWMEEIEGALREASAYVFLLTPTSVTSPNVQFEMGAALQRWHDESGTRIIPILFGDVDRKDVPAVLPERLLIDTNELDYSEYYERLKEQLETSLAGLKKDELKGSDDDT